jgi:hypothetical protein
MQEQVVYWANLSEVPTNEFTINPLINNIAKAQSLYPGENHVACPAIRNKHSNTFFSTIPYDIEVKIDNGYFLSSSHSIGLRQGLYENSYAFNWHIGRIFFSFSEQMMEVSPAFLHKTSYSQYGHAPSGAFDIGKWFRPSIPTFQLWENETEFKAKQGEAHLYFNFPNEKKIRLQEFNMTERLYEIMILCLNFKNIRPKQPLSSNYNMFESGGLRQEVITEIMSQ